jgi:hypothetical protein
VRNLMRRGADLVANKQAAHVAVPITYTAGPVALELRAVVGATATDNDNGDGLVVRSQVRDYLIEAADLSIDGVAFEPKRGDVIDDRGQRFEVMPIGNEGAWRWSDRDNRRYRIHTRWQGVTP